MKKNNIKTHLNKNSNISYLQEILDKYFIYNNIKIRPDKNKDDFIILDGKINWKAFTYNAEELIYTFNKDDFFFSSDYSLISGELFECAIFHSGEGFSMFFIFEDIKNINSFNDINLNINNIEISHIAGLQEAFEDNGLKISEIEQNVFSFSVLNEQLYFNSFKEYEDTIKRILNKLGIKYSEKLEENLYLDVKEHNKDSFIKDNIDIMSTEEFNTHIRYKS